MMLSKARVRSAARPAQQQKDAARKPPDLESFLAARDYVGAITLLRARQHQQQQGLEWQAYVHFHSGEHDKHHTYAAACLFHMGEFEAAEEEALKGPRSQLQARILFHCAHKRGDEAALMARHQELSEGLEDELSLAAVHFQRAHFQEATDTYKRLLLAHRDCAALGVYAALCYARLDYYDASQDVLAEYLSAHPTSPFAVNLKACNAFKLADGRAAEAALRALSDAGAAAALREVPLLRHNACVFRSGEAALQVLPALVDALPEARPNLVIFHLRRGDVGAAYGLVKNAGVVHALLGQREGSAEHLRLAQQAFQVVGSSTSECDTIPGRQAMAACFFLLRQYGDVLVFLESIRSYFAGDDDFNWNWGMALAAAGRHAEAEGALAAVGSAERDPAYVAWRARALAMTGRAAAAWELLAAHEAGGGDGGGGADGGGGGGGALLRQLGDDAYRTGQFAAFDSLERLDPDPAWWDAKLGACAGAMQAVAAGKESVTALSEAVALLEAGPAGGGAPGPHADGMARVMRRWAEERGLEL
ncbi:hypothetical protein Rsub_10518 [Raphidocelis subcapitata]|uniref:Uncharacterized protein n=1 Tax=Raphidocelis subcapitata TaxID=307507 RepID=A0A2V0PF85_9CHLO|nr:hypothetical protein Rsub_10518 [Raphidocelis subcapitata]|eukprot:GBF97642.1 hypothetical protein Rsub_10518 [Raphidocelis subcapitata]